jgi:hypothetical protein
MSIGVEGLIVHNDCVIGMEGGFHSCRRYSLGGGGGEVGRCKGRTRNRQPGRHSNLLRSPILFSRFPLEPLYLGEVPVLNGILKEEDFLIR